MDDNKKTMLQRTKLTYIFRSVVVASTQTSFFWFPTLFTIRIYLGERYTIICDFDNNQTKKSDKTHSFGSILGIPQR